jgi:hypothetical protein
MCEVVAVSPASSPYDSFHVVRYIKISVLAPPRNLDSTATMYSELTLNTVYCGTMKYSSWHQNDLGCVGFFRSCRCPLRLTSNHRNNEDGIKTAKKRVREKKLQP